MTYIYLFIYILETKTMYYIQKIAALLIITHIVTTTTITTTKLCHCANTKLVVVIDRGDLRPASDFCVIRLSIHIIIDMMDARRGYVFHAA